MKQHIDERLVGVQGLHVLQIAKEQHDHQAASSQTRGEGRSYPFLQGEEDEAAEIGPDAGGVEQPGGQRHQHAEHDQDERGVAVFEQQPDGQTDHIDGYEDTRELHDKTKLP